MRRRIATVLAVLAAAALTGCGSGSDVRSHLDDTYAERSSSGDATTYVAPEPPGPTARQISGAVPPVAQTSDAGSEYLRYSDDIVVVSPAGSTSTVRVEDLEGAYCNGAYTYLGPGFDPGSPAADCDDPNDAK